MVNANDEKLPIFGIGHFKKSRVFLELDTQRVGSDHE